MERGDLAGTVRRVAGIYSFEDAKRCVMCASSAARVVGRRLDRHQGLRARRVAGAATTIVKCRGCGLIYANPRPVTETVGDHYDMEPEEYWKPGYFVENESYFRGEIDIFRELYTGSRRPVVLDVGAGLGKAMHAFERAGFEAYGLEPSMPFHSRAIEGGISADRLQLGTAEDAQYPQGQFDLVSFGAVVEHLHRPDAVIEKAMTWLRPGGLIHAEVPSSKWMIGRGLNLLYRLQGSDLVTNLSPMHPPFHLYEFTLDSFKEHGRRAGYEVAYDQRFVGDVFLPASIARFISRLMVATGTEMQLQVWLRPTAR